MWVKGVTNEELTMRLAKEEREWQKAKWQKAERYAGSKVFVGPVYNGRVLARWISSLRLRNYFIPEGIKHILTWFISFQMLREITHTFLIMVKD